MPHFIIKEECAVCAACEAECPVGAVSLHRSNEYYVIDPELCTDCADCVEMCPTDAIKTEDGEKSEE